MGQSRSKLATFKSSFGFNKQGTLAFDEHGRRLNEPKINQPTGDEEKSWAIINTTAVGHPIEEFQEKYEMTTQVLGSGSYARVLLARTLPANDLVAVKVLDKKKMDPEDIIDVRKEVALLSALSHENIVQVYEFFENDSVMYLTMEYISAGELFTSVEQLMDYTEKDTRDIMFTLISALLYCKNMGIAHRDIKPENILLRSKITKTKKKKPPMRTDRSGLIAINEPILETSFKAAKRKYEIVLADFGFAAQVAKKDMAAALETQCGSPLFTAPEIIKSQKYNYKCDIWSLGIVCYVLLSGGTFPFMGRNAEELFENISFGSYKFDPPEAWQKVSPEGKDFVKKMLMLKVNKRATYEELMDHEWLKDRSKAKFDLKKSVNFDAMKRYNAKRKMLKVIKARQAADVFKQLMNDVSEGDLEETMKQPHMISLEDFYTNANIKAADKEIEEDKVEEVKRIQSTEEEEEEEEEETPIVENVPGDIMSSAFFTDVDTLI